MCIHKHLFAVAQRYQNMLFVCLFLFYFFKLLVLVFGYF